MMLAAAATAFALSLPFPVVAHASLHGVAHRSFHHSAHSSLQGRDDSKQEVQLHNVQLQNCPLACEYATSDSSTWTVRNSGTLTAYVTCTDTCVSPIMISMNSRLATTRSSSRSTFKLALRLLLSRLVSPRKAVHRCRLVLSTVFFRIT